MPGRGNRGGNDPDRKPSPTLGGKIGDEVRSALRLLFKSVDQQAVDLSIQAPFTAYLTEIPCEATTVPLRQSDIQVSEDPIQALRERQPVVNQLALIEEVSLAESAPCQLQPALCKEPMIAQAEVVMSRVSFENVCFTESHGAPLEPITAQLWHKPIDGIQAPQVSNVPAMRFTTRDKSLKDRLPSTQIRENPRLFALPIRKTPIPPHRFSPAVRDIFRRFLAEKAGVPANNVQLKIVFERMNVAFYASIQQDEQGHLLCVPKNELIGKNVQGKAGQALLERMEKNTENAYLVVGFRLDNKQDIRAMVPVDKIPAGPYTQKPDRGQPHA